MENEKILKRHEDRKDLAGEHAFGDVVSKAFKPYDHDMNLALFQSICAHYEIAISQKDAEGLIRGY